jgi:hypothetical protein
VTVLDRHDPFVTIDEPPVRTPGDFRRNAKGTPYIAHPTDKVKSGARKGKPKWIVAARSSSIGKLTTDTTNLERRSERGIVEGLLLNPAVRQRLEHATTADIDGIIGAAKDAARLDLAADRGTHVHSLIECVNKDQSWRRHDQAGEALDITPDMADAIVDAWLDAVKAWGLEALASETTVANIAVPCAGTLDALVRTTKPLTFGDVTIPAGTLLVLDIKTGAATGAANGYWTGYPAQLFAYATSKPYTCREDDPDDEHAWGEWDTPPSTEHGLIAHLNLADVINGEAPAWTLIHVDLTAGARHLDLVAQAKAYNAASPTYFRTINQEDSSHEAGAQGSPDRQDHGTGIPTSEPNQDVGGCAVVDQSRTVQDDRQNQPSGSSAGSGTPTPSVALTRADELAAVPTRAPDEGHDCTELADALWLDTWRTDYQALDAAGKSWIGDVWNQGARHGVSWHMGANAGGRITERRVWLLAGLVRLVKAGNDNADTLRALIATTVDADWPLFANVEPGHALGVLDVIDAQVFAGLADALATDDGPLRAALDAMTTAA